MRLFYALCFILLVCCPWKGDAIIQSNGGFGPGLNPESRISAQYQTGCNGIFEETYNREIAPRLGAGQHYMDYTGSSIYLDSQVKGAADELLSGVYGNPHSVNPSSHRTTVLVEDMRDTLLRYFNADPEIYELVFVRSATGGLQLLGENFPWSSQGNMAYLVSNHNSVLGIREYAKKNGAGKVGAVSEEEVEAWLEDPKNARWKNTAFHVDKIANKNDSNCHNHHQNGQEKPKEPSTFSLFAFPAQDNFAGVLYPLRWVSQVQSQSTRDHRWLVLLDAAAFAPTHRLDLSATPADFVVLSFYKMFGMPTGVGAWIMRKDASAIMPRSYWGGGSVFTAGSEFQWHVRHVGNAHWEDGTLPFLNIMALKYGLEAMENLGGIDVIHDHVTCVGNHLAFQLASLQHSTGPMLRLFGKHFEGSGTAVQAAVANFLILKPDGEVFSYKTAGIELSDAGFHVREGCMCNPGACYAAVGVHDEEVRDLAFKMHNNYTDWEWIEVEREGRIVKRPLGTLRVSLGWMSRIEDVDALIGFLMRNFRDRNDDVLQEGLGHKKKDRRSHFWQGGC